MSLKFYKSLMSRMFLSSRMVRMFNFRSLPSSRIPLLDFRMLNILPMARTARGEGMALRIRITLTTRR